MAQIQQNSSHKDKRIYSQATQEDEGQEEFSQENWG